MLYSIKDGRVLTRGLEYSVSYHCNLFCAGCSHLSPFSQKKFPSIDSFCDDINKLREGLHTLNLRLLGGEPLLNPDISVFIEEAKKSGIADIVSVTTNGILLHTMDDDFWENVDLVRITMYPEYQPKEKFIQIFKEQALNSDTRLQFNVKPNFRTTIVTEPHPKDWITNMIFNTCINAHKKHCHMIHEGKLYKCAVPPFLPEYLSKMNRDDYNPKDDAFDIHNSTNIFHDLTSYFTSSKTMDACRFCLGYVGRRQKYHQLEKNYIYHPERQNIQRTTHLDPKVFFMNCALYHFRRFLEHTTRYQFW